MPIGIDLQGSLVNNSGTTMVSGEIIRVSGTNLATKAQADTTAHTFGLYGVVTSGSVANGGSVQAATESAKDVVFCDAGLTINGGDRLYISAATAGRATNVAPANAFVIGVVLDPTQYARTGRVVAMFDASGGFNVAPSGGGSTLSAAYAAGAGVSDQTLTLLNAKGRGVVIDATNAGFDGTTNALQIKGNTGLAALAPYRATGAGSNGEAFRADGGAQKFYVPDNPILLDGHAGGVFEVDGVGAGQWNANRTFAIGSQSAQLAPSATDGFGCHASMAGAPTGTPAASFVAGAPLSVPIVPDTTGKIVWWYDTVGLAWYAIPLTTTATWAAAGIRVFAIDGVNGNDLNKGYADSPDLTAANYVIASAAAGLVAKKTIAGLAAIFPRNGANRTFEIIIANGGSNTTESYTDDLATIMGGTNGYKNSSCVRGTGTNTTAGCTAFDGSAADVAYVGGITAPGLNANGYNPTAGATTTSIPCQLNGGGAAGFGAEPAAPWGYRIRFDAATATTALRNVSGSIGKVTGGNTVLTSQALPAAPSTSDVFYIEQAGINFTVGLTLNVRNSTGTLNLAGLQTSTSITLGDGFYRTSFLQSTTTWTASNCPSLNMAQSYTHPVRSTAGAGASRAGTSSSLSNSVTTSAGLATVTSSTITNPTTLTLSPGFAVGTNLTFSVCKNLASGGSGGNPLINIGANAALVSFPVRTIAGVVVLQGGGTLSIAQIDIEANSANNGCFQVEGQWFLNFATAGTNIAITGTNTGGSSYGFNYFNGNQSAFDMAFGSKVNLDPSHLPTVTGAVANVNIANGGTSTWAGAAAYRDVAVAFTQTNYSSVLSTQHSGTLTGAAGATNCYLADAADAAGSANPLNYILAAGSTFLQFNVKPRSNAMTQNSTATLYKNGSSTGISVTIPAGSTTAVVVGALTQFNGADNYDIRLDNPGPDATHVLAVSVTVLWSSGA